MSKCREAFIAYQGFTPERLPSEWVDWLCAWNAALDCAIAIAEEQEGCITDSSALLIRREKTEC